MKYISLDIIENGCIKHKEWVIDAIFTSRFSHIIKYIVEEETEHFCNNNPYVKEKEKDISICDCILNP